ncbi:MAG: hypothetical protein QXL96_04670 [Ignisphaera sp.]
MVCSSVYSYSNLFFLPAIPYIAEAMLGLHYLSIALYWILLTITSITVGVKAIKGDDK